MDHLQQLGDKIKEYDNSEERKISGSISLLAIQVVSQCLNISDSLFNFIQVGSEEQGVTQIFYDNHPITIIHPGVNIVYLEVKIVESLL